MRGARDGMGRSDVEIIAYGGEGEGESRRGFEDGEEGGGGGGDTCVRDGGVFVEHTRDGAAPSEQLEDLQWDGGAREREREESVPCVVCHFQGVRPVACSCSVFSVGVVCWRE